MKNNFKPQRVSSRAAATNPIARAIAWRKLVGTCTDAKVILYDLKDGADCTDVINSVGWVCVFVDKCAERSALRAPTSPHQHLMDAVQEGITACDKLRADGFKWRASVVTTLDDALDACALLAKLVTPHSIAMTAQELAR